MKRLLLYIVFLFAATGSAIALSLHTTDVASDFQRGKSMYIEGNYTGCIDVLQALLRREEANAFAEDAEYFIAMSHVKQGNGYVPSMLDNYLRNYPASPHRAEVRMALGDYYYYKGDYRTAVEKYRQLDLDDLRGDMQDDWCFRSAFSFLQTGEAVRALPLFTALAQNSPRYRNAARYYEGHIYYEQKRYKEAYRSLSQVEPEAEYGKNALSLMAHIDFANGNYDRVISTGERLLAIGDEGQKPDIHRIVGESYFLTNNYPKAAEHLSQYVTDSDATDRNALYMLGVVKYHEGQYDEALHLLGRTTKEEDAICQNAYLHIGLCYLRLQDNKSATLAFEKAASYRYDDAVRETALYNYALCAYENNFSMFDHTIAIFEQFLNEYPRSVYADDINSRLSDLYLNTRNYNTALAAIDRIKKPSQQLLVARQQILYLLGTEAFADNRIDEAAKWFTQAVKMEQYAPEYYARSLFWLGECSYRNNSYREALKYYRRFLASGVTTDAETLSLAHYNEAYTRFQLHEYGEALSAFNRFLKSDNITPAMRIDAYNCIGDCYYYARNYAKAEEFYARSVAMQGGGSEYAMLQQAVMAGLNKKYAEKIAILDKLIKGFPQSEYIEEAYNEMGQTYIEMGRQNDAIKTYQQVAEKYPATASARQALLQLGMLYYNAGKTTQSITAYRDLITRYPSSKEAKVAAEDLKTIYIEQNNVSELTAFMQSQGTRYESAEVDSLSYIAAERSYMRDRNTSALESYTTQYPQGYFASQAHYYIGREAFGKKTYDKALEHFTASLNISPDGEFAEEALARRSEILYMRKEYEKAQSAFERLEQIAESADNKQAARLGLLRVGVGLKQHDRTIAAADKLLADTKLSPELKQEALYGRATSYRLTGESGKAADDYLALSSDTRSEYGAEAAYRVAQFYYDSGELKKAEKAADKFIDAGTPHAYWLARGILLLADIYAANGDTFKARQYIESLQNNYPGSDDDIATRITEKLDALP